MGLFDRIWRGLPSASRRGAPARGVGASPTKQGDLFDDEFQRKLETLALVSRKVFAGRLRAERRTKKKGSGVEFADHRDYVPGDDFRAVDWNAYQRFGRLLVRLYEEEEDLSIYFIVDCSSSMGFVSGGSARGASSAKFDYARRLAAALAYVGLANLDRVTVVGMSDQVVARMPTTRGKGRIFRVFNFLRELSPTGVTDLGEGMRTFVAQHKRRGLAVLISDLYDHAGFERGINVLRYAKFEPFVLHIVDPAEARPELNGDVRIYDCETGDEREVTITPAVLERMQLAWREYQESVERFCASRQVPYFPADINVPFDELILKVFRRGGFLR
ncbi:MAG: DUF58 domain-containing protein [Polyangiaceae bacterium]|nr:DUF58 domain-containing protein [Polyangiaceae bacterium]MCW5789923.1 DUF58 domain-containing protein [Polyangiaceae bacterium]